jgi:hypothetical protein
MFGSATRCKALRWLPAALSLALLSCGPSTEFYRNVESDLANRQYDSAIDQVRAHASDYGDKSIVLYELDMGLLFHYAGQYDSSNAYLLAAEREIDDLYTKSISLAAVSVILNDNVLPYEGEDFEKVLINVFLALNFASKNEPDEALVEARKVDLKLREYARQYEGKNTYQEDAFVRYIMGALYESAGEINDAYISYRQAHDAYAIYENNYGTSEPSFLLDDLVRTATLMSFDEEAAEFQALGGSPFERSGRPFGSLIVIAYAGRGPIKHEIRPSVSIADDKGVVHTFQVALPKFGSRFNSDRKYEIIAWAADSTGADTVYSEVGENVSAIAAKALDDRIALVYLKSGGRALLKFLASEKAKAGLTKKEEDKVGNFLKSLAVDLAVGASEHADLRTWRTLPAEVQIARLYLSPGEYLVSVSGTDGKQVMQASSFSVRAKRTTFLIVDDLR